MRRTTKNRIKDCLSVAMLTVATVTLALCLPDCRSTLTTSTETYEASADAIRTATRRADSVYVHDSIYVYAAPDTLRVERWRTAWRERTVHDTVREYHTDTVVKEKEVEKETTTPPALQPTRTPRWAWALALLVAGLVIMQIIRVKNRLNRL